MLGSENEPWFVGDTIFSGLLPVTVLKTVNWMLVFCLCESDFVGVILSITTITLPFPTGSMTMSLSFFSSFNACNLPFVKLLSLTKADCTNDYSTANSNTLFIIHLASPLFTSPNNAYVFTTNHMTFFQRLLYLLTNQIAHLCSWIFNHD